MNRVRKLANPQRHLKSIRNLWWEDIETIKGAWWYGQLEMGPRRILYYQLDLIEFILNHAINTPECTVYKFGFDGLAVKTEYPDFWWVNGLCVRPALIKSVSGKSSGIGEKLLKFVEYDAKRNKINRISLKPGHWKLRSYYERNGYHFSGIIKKVGKVWSKDIKGKNESPEKVD